MQSKGIVSVLRKEMTVRKCVCGCVQVWGVGYPPGGWWRAAAVRAWPWMWPCSARSPPRLCAGQPTFSRCYPSLLPLPSSPATPPSCVMPPSYVTPSEFCSIDFFTSPFCTPFPRCFHPMCPPYSHFRHASFGRSSFTAGWVAT